MRATRTGDSATDAGGADTERHLWGKALGAALGVSVALVVILLAFLWPVVTAAPRDVPIGITGPAMMVERFSAEAPEAFALREVGDRGAAVAAIEAREIYGAVVLDPAGPEVLLSSAASPLIAAQLGALAPVLQQQLAAAAAGVGAGAPQPAPGAAPVVVEVTDVVPLSDRDPRGVGLGASSFPLVIGGVLGGVAVSIAVVGIWRRLVAVLIYAAVSGTSLAAVMQLWLGVLQGDLFVNAAALALGLLAVAGPIAGLAALLGRAGAGLGAVTFLLGANPISAAAQPVEFLAAPWGAVGQWFPPGAAATLLRNLSYFPQADAMSPWLVLGAWAIGGVTLMCAAQLLPSAALHGRGSGVRAR